MSKVVLNKILAEGANPLIHQLAFDNSSQPHILKTSKDGKILFANTAACKLLGYSKKQLLAKSRSDIFDVSELSFKKILKERISLGKSSGNVVMIKKSGKRISCAITSAVFTGNDGIETSITTITDMREPIRNQKRINLDNEKIVAENIGIAKLNQRKIDIQKEKVVADNIVLAKSKQKKIDVKNQKIVAVNIVLAKSNQKKIDVKNKKIVEDNIVLAKSNQRKIDVKNKKIVEDNIGLAKSNQKKIDVKNRKIVEDNIVLAKSKQKKIDTKKKKLVADNIILALGKSQTKLAENNAWIKHIAKTSYDVMWDWNVVTNEIYVGKSAEEIFGYKVKNNIIRLEDFKKCVSAPHLSIVEKGISKALSSGDKAWAASYMFKRYDGSFATVTSRASIVRDSKGKAVRLIGATQDVSRIQELEKNLYDQIMVQGEVSEVFDVLTKLSFAGIWEWNLLTQEFQLSGGYEQLFGYPLTNSSGNPKKDWLDHIHADERDLIEKDLNKAIASKVSHWERTYRFLRANKSVAKVFNRATIMRDENGKAYRMIGVMQDTSLKQIAEKKLQNEIKLKERQIAEATEDAKDAERSHIGKELHDNVNQLLGVSRLYLQMAQKGDHHSEMYLSRSSEYTLQAIDEIRKLTKALTTDTIRNIGLVDAIENIVQDTMETNSVKIIFSCNGFKESTVSDKFKLNIYRIIQEQLNNILKHARAKKVIIGIRQTKKLIKLTINDNGIGFDRSKKTDGIGLTNIISRARSYQGIANIDSEPGKGCIVSITFPVEAAAN